MNIEDIKEQLSDMKRLVYTHIEPDMYEAHVNHLLSIIEKQTEYLLTLKDFADKSRETNLYMGTIYYGLEEALQVIRGK